MLLAELYTMLAVGELNQHPVVQSGTIRDDLKQSINVALNKALTLLHGELALKDSEVVIQQYPEITEYILQSKYAISNTSSTAPVKYIIDSTFKPFKDDILRITTVYDEGGNAIPLKTPMNDTSDASSWFTSRFDTLQIPAPNGDNCAIVAYTANHPKIALDADPDTTYVEVPVGIEELITSYIASKLYIAVGNAASAQLSGYYSSKFGQLLREVKSLGLYDVSTGDANTRFSARGYV